MKIKIYIVQIKRVFHIIYDLTQGQKSGDTLVSKFTGEGSYTFVSVFHGNNF